jgi:hypothetical protein
MCSQSHRVLCGPVRHDQQCVRLCGATRELHVDAFAEVLFNVPPHDLENANRIVVVLRRKVHSNQRKRDVAVRVEKVRVGTGEHRSVNAKELGRR